MSRDPIRMADLTDGASSEDEFMRAVIRAERTELPAEAKMAELSKRLGPMITERTPVAPSAPLWRWLLWAGLVAGLAAVAIRAGTRTSSRSAGTQEGRELAAVTVETGAPSIAPAPPPAVSAEALLPPAPVVAVESLPSVTPPARARAVAPPPAPECTGEIELLDRADAALRAGDANRALSLTREHSERCPGGAFVQERERIAIDALSRLGRHGEMRARAASFEARFPSSPHLQRIRSLVGQRSE